MQRDIYKLARMLEEAALLMEIRGDNGFKTKAYTNGAEIIRSNSDTVNTANTAEELTHIAGIGKALSEKIIEYKETGELRFYNAILEEMPATLLDLAKLKGLGPKKTAQLYNQYSVKDIPSLDKFVSSGEINNVKGFGPKSIATLQKNIDYKKKTTGHLLLSTATEEAESIAQNLLEYEFINKVGITGEIAQAQESVSQIDIAIGFDSDRLNENDQLSLVAKEILREARTVDNGFGSSVISYTNKGKRKVLLHFTDVSNFHWLNHYLSMEKEYEESFVNFLSDTGWDITNRINPTKSGNKVEFKSKEEVYDKAGLQYVPTELRSEAQTVHFAANGYLPKLVESADLRGLIHCHSTWSDGKNTISEMAEAARSKGMNYMLITDHSQTAAYANGLTPDRIKRQHEEIDKLNEAYKGKFKILKGIESDILPDGSLDYEDSVLESFDAIVGSVHGQFDLDIKKQTQRIARALSNPYLSILGHSTGRLLLRRPGYKLDMDEILAAAAANGKVIEINSNPYRLDISWRYLKEGKSQGIKFSINPDAHNTLGISHVEYGVKMARRGWLSSEDIVNTYDSSAFLASFKK
ncbi:MAG: DNA polymerase/3'-5' exonuclease PolX [Candidatus Kapaibacteriales bacterium]